MTENRADLIISFPGDGNEDQSWGSSYRD